MYDLEHFTLKDMTECGATLRKLGAGCQSMEEIAQRTVEHLYKNLVAGPKRERATALVRFFMTRMYGNLDKPLQRAVHSTSDITLVTETPCLTLLAAAGSRAEWCCTKESAPQHVLALPDPALSERHPIIAQLVARFDLPGAFSVRYNPNYFFEEPGQNYDVLYVPDLLNDHVISEPQHEFIRNNNIKSIVGFGGLLPSRNLFAVEVFSRVMVSKQVVLAFRPFPLNTKIALLPFDDADSVFTSQVDLHGKC